MSWVTVSLEGFVLGQALLFGVNHEKSSFSFEYNFKDVSSYVVDLRFILCI